MFRNSRDAMAIALLELGYSLNTEDYSKLQEAAEEKAMKEILTEKQFKKWQMQKKAHPSTQLP